MKKVDLFNTSFKALRINRSRSFLTILGIVIGVCSVILMLSVGRSAEDLILSQVADLGSDLLFAEPSSTGDSSGPPDIFVEQSLSLEDRDILLNSPFFDFVDATLFTTTTVSVDAVSEFTQISGTTGDYLSIFPADILQGRYFDESDINSASRVAVLGRDAAEKFFGFADPIGERVKIKNTSFRVIGVLDEQGSRFFQNLDEQIAVPVTALQQYILGVDYVSFLSARVSDEFDIEFAEEEMRVLLRDSGGLDEEDGDNFAITSQSEAQDTVGVIGNVLTILLASIAAISLVVGGIGIMNIMLVSVTERTKEIGLRKALGATKKDILRQFLLEAVLITFIGGLLGVVLGVVLARLSGIIASQYVDGWTSVIPASGIFLGAAVSTIIGLVFGLYPAMKAANLQPVDALRYE